MEDIMKENRSVGIEGVKHQMNDPVVGELETCFTDLIRLTRNNPSKLANAISYFRDEKTKVVIDSIDNILYKRFGFKIKHVSYERNYGVFPVTPITNNPISVDREDLRKYIDIVLENQTTQPHINPKMPVSDEDAVKNVLWGIKELDKQMVKDGIVVDFDTATIKGLPEETRIIMFADYHFLIRTCNLTARQIVAILMHEVGHAFTHVSNTYRSIKNTTRLLETMKGEVTDESTGKDIVRLAYRNVLGQEKDVEDKSIPTLYVEFVDDMLRSNLGFDVGNPHYATDSEELADNFSAKFGLGLELAVALKGMRENGPSLSKLFFTPDSIIYGVYISLVTFVLSLSVTMAVAAPFVAFAIGYLLIKISRYVIDIITLGDASESRTYDYDERRVIRIKNTMVNRLRTAKLDKEEKKQMVANIEEVVSTSKFFIKYSNERFTAKFMNNLLAFNRTARDSKKIEEAIEDLMENDLHVASNKLRTIQ
jgi:hypothetical protein